MRGLIRASMMNPWAVTVFALTIILIGTISLTLIPIDILPTFKSPAVQVLTFYSGMPPKDVEMDITNRMERWTDMAAGLSNQESRSILGASIVRNYFQPDTSEGEAISSVLSWSQSVIQYLPPGTLPPVCMAFDPTTTTPACLIALNGEGLDESTLWDIGRYEVRSRIMTIPGAVSPVVFGGKIRAIQFYLDRQKLQARNMSPLDVLKAVDESNVFLPTGELIIGDMDYFLDSNSMFKEVGRMAEIPLRTEHGNRAFVGDVATPTDDAMIQTTIVRVDGRKQVYIPVMRQKGASTLRVIEDLQAMIPTIESELSKPVHLDLIMDQSVFVRQSIKSLTIEGILGAGLCSLTIFMFLGRWQMTAIAVMTIPLSVLSALAFLYMAGQTINVMTLSGLSLAIGPMVDSAIICLENTDRYLEEGIPSNVAALKGASEVALPELVSSLVTFLALMPLAVMPGMTSFLFGPLALAVGGAMTTAYILSRSLIPTCASAWLKPKKTGADAKPNQMGMIGRAFDRWQRGIDRFIEGYGNMLDVALRYRWITVIGAFGSLILILLVLTGPIRREFFPQADAGSLEMYVRAPSGTRLRVTNDRIVEVEDFLKKHLPPKDVQLIVSEIGVTPDWSSAYTQNAGKMDTIVRIQFTEERSKGSYEYANELRTAFAAQKRFRDLEFSFNAGGMIRGALNEGKTAPINIRVKGKNQKSAHRVADLIRRKVANIEGVVDCRIIQRLDYPEYIIDVDRAKAADLGLTQEDVMKSVIGAFNSSIQFNKSNFWIDENNGNQYFVGVQYPQTSVESVQTLLDVPLTGVNQNSRDSRVEVYSQPSITPGMERSEDHVNPAPVLLSSLVKLRRGTIPTEITHQNILPTMDLNVGTEGRDLGHIADEIYEVIDGKFGRLKTDKASAHDAGSVRWDAYDPDSNTRRTLEGTSIQLSGEYAHMNQMFSNLGVGLSLAVFFIYFITVALDKSFMVPFCVHSAVPLILVGVWPMLYFTGTSLNVQSLLGIIFSIGIKVANTILMTDLAQHLRKTEGLSPFEAIRKAAKLRVRPVTMTALAAFFAMIPTALALETGSEANAPMGRAILGGLLAGEPATLFVVPCLYAIMIRGKPTSPEDPEAAEHRLGLDENENEQVDEHENDRDDSDDDQTYDEPNRNDHKT
jgi:multidrug efflux pump subunit AcrB